MSSANCQSLLGIKEKVPPLVPGMTAQEFNLPPVTQAVRKGEGMVWAGGGSHFFRPRPGDWSAQLENSAYQKPLL